MAHNSLSAASEAPLALFCYCFSSILMTLMNKYVLSGHQFHLNLFLLCVQSAVSIVFLAGCKQAKLLEYRSLNRQDAWAWFPVSLLLVAMIYTGSKALQFLTVSMFTVFKNITIVLIALGEVRLFGARITALMWLSFVLIIGSSVVGGLNDLAFDAWGYGWMVVNCVVTAGYILGMRRTIKAVGFADFDSVYFNNCLAAPVMLLLSLLCEDWSQFGRDYLSTTGGMHAQLFPLTLGILVSSVSAFAISYSTAWSVRVASSTTYSVVGALNKLPVAISGLIFFAEPVNAGRIASIVLAFVAGLLYSWAQICLKAEQAKPSLLVEKEADAHSRSLSHIHIQK